MSKSKASRTHNPSFNNGSPVSGSAAFDKAVQELRHSSGAFPNISGRWIFGALLGLIAAGLLCAWGTLCLLYWQGSWQLLYHPKAQITETPAAAGLSFEAVRFAATETGINRLSGWWIPAENARFTALYLHGANGNLSDTVNALAAFHEQGVNVFAIDYRGYGLSQSREPAENRPSEKRLRQDVEWALTWLTLTRQIPAKKVIVSGTGLGANLAVELAADHPELAGVLLDGPLQDATGAIFADSRSRLVPAHLLVADRYDLNAAARAVRVPSLWLLSRQPATINAQPAYEAAGNQKSAVWLNTPSTADPQFGATLRRWLDDL